MNTNKEKKLNSLKSEILEITECVVSEKKDKVSDIITGNENEIDSNDTFTLTNIVNNEQNIQTKNDLAEIKNELYTLKSMLTKQEIVLKEISLKIKWVLF